MASIADLSLGDVIAFEVLEPHWRWELGVVQAKPSERVTEVVIYKPKWAPMPKTARKGAHETSEEEEEDIEAELDSTFVENKGKLRIILSSSVFYNLGNEDAHIGGDGHIRLESSIQTAVEQAIKNVSINSGGGGGFHNDEQPDILESTTMPKFKLNLPRNENEGMGAGYIAIPLATGRAKGIMGDESVEEGASANEKVAALTALTVEYEAQIASLIEQVEQLRSIGGSAAAAVPTIQSGAASPLSDTGASPRKVKIVLPPGKHSDPLAELAALPSDVESLRIQLKAATKQLSENRIKYEREMQTLKDKNTELQSVFEGWGAVAGTLYGNLTPGTIADLKNARETLQTARATYRKTARKSNVADASGENQLNAAEALLDLQQQMVSFINSSDDRGTTKATPAKKASTPTVSKSPSLAASPASPVRHAPKVPSTRPAPLPVGQSPNSPSLSMGSKPNSSSNRTPLRAPGSPFLSPPSNIPARAQKAAASLNASGHFEPSTPSKIQSTAAATGTVIVNVASPPVISSGQGTIASPGGASSPLKDSTIVINGAETTSNPLNFNATSTASEMTLKGSTGTLSGSTVTDSLGTTAKARPKSKPKPKPLSRSVMASTGGGSEGSPSSTTMGSMSLLSEFTRACNNMQLSQRESDDELAKLRKDNEDNAKKLAEMLTQIENMKKMKDKELAMLRVQIERLDAAAIRKTEGSIVLDARELVKEDISNMPSASPLKPH